MSTREIIILSSDDDLEPQKRPLNSPKREKLKPKRRKTVEIKQNRENMNVIPKNIPKLSTKGSLIVTNDLGVPILTSKPVKPVKRQPESPPLPALENLDIVEPLDTPQEMRKSATMHAEMLSDICNGIMETDLHLLSLEEVLLLDSLSRLTLEAKALFMYLFNRGQNKWIRILHNSNYSFDATTSLEELSQAGLVHSHGPETFEESAMLLSTEELKEMANVVLFGKPLRRISSSSTNSRAPSPAPSEESIVSENFPVECGDVRNLKNKAAKMLNVKLSAKKEQLLQTLIKQASTQPGLEMGQDGNMQMTSRLYLFQKTVMDTRGPVAWMPRYIRDVMEKFLVLHLRSHGLPSMVQPGSTSLDTSGASPVNTLPPGKDSGQQLLQWPLLSRIGIKPCPELKVQRCTWWQTKREFDEFYQAIKVKQTAEMLSISKSEDAKQWTMDFLDACDVENWFDRLVRDYTPLEDEFEAWKCSEWHAGRVLAQILELKSSLATKRKEFDEEGRLIRKILNQNVFANGDRPRLFARLALVLHHHLDLKQEARGLCINALQDSTVRTKHRQDLLRRLKMIEDDLEIPVQDQLMESLELHGKPGPPIQVIQGYKYKTTQMGKSGWKPKMDSEQLICSVEEFALQHYRSLGWEGAHWEGGFVGLIVGLASLSVLLDTGIPGAFQHKDSSIPLDLYSGPLFYNRRRAKVEKLLEDLQMRGVEMILEADDVYREVGRQGTSLWGVEWIPRLDLELIVKSLTNDGIKKFCEVVLKDVRGTTGGFPDLTLWREGEVMFVEVKGPGDKLMKSQEVWMERLEQMGLNAIVCKVEEEKRRCS